MRLLLRSIAIVAIVLCPSPAEAQGGRQGTVRVDLSTATINFPSPGFADFDAGWIDHPGLVVSVTSRPLDRDWELRVQGDGGDLGGYGKPLSDLYWRLEGSSAWTPLDGTGQTLAAGQGDEDVTVYFRLLLDWGRDLPDNYSVGLTFTAVRP